MKLNVNVNSLTGMRWTSLYRKKKKKNITRTVVKKGTSSHSEQPDFVQWLELYH